MITNQTNKKIISKKFKICKGIFSKSLGLMFKIKAKTLIFIFKKEEFVPLHMIFVFFPIDVLFLNKNKEVIEIKQNFKPFSFYNPKNRAKYV